jgi:aspartokinase-like uncharacterized kinase
MCVWVERVDLFVILRGGRESICFESFCFVESQRRKKISERATHRRAIKCMHGSGVLSQRGGVFFGSKKERQDRYLDSEKREVWDILMEE